MVDQGTGDFSHMPVRKRGVARFASSCVREVNGQAPHDFAVA